jgi:hypothetical protein
MWQSGVRSEMCTVRFESRRWTIMVDFEHLDAIIEWMRAEIKTIIKPA